MKKSAWLIVDQKVGNANQAIAIAKAMGVNYEIKTLEYNFLFIRFYMILIRFLFDSQMCVYD